MAKSTCPAALRPSRLARWLGTPSDNSERASAEPSTLADPAELPALLRASARGDRRAFERLYQLTSGRMLALVRRTVWHRGEAEEVLQELYVRIWRHAATYDPERAQAMAWLGRIARNLAVDHLRRNAARAAHEQADLPSTLTDTGAGAIERCADPSGGPAEQLASRQLSVQAKALLDELNPGQRCVLILSFWEGLSQTEVAARLGLPVGTVKSTMRRSLMALKAAHERQLVLQASSAARARLRAPHDANLAAEDQPPVHPLAALA